VKYLLAAMGLWFVAIWVATFAQTGIAKSVHHSAFYFCTAIVVAYWAFVVCWWRSE